MREALQAEVDEVNKRFARVEQIKRFAILYRDLTQAAGELTPTMQVNRAVVSGRYRDTLERLDERAAHRLAGTAHPVARRLVRAHPADPRLRQA